MAFILFDEVGNRVASILDKKVCTRIVEAIPEYDYAPIDGRTSISMTTESIEQMNKDRADGMKYHELANKYNVSITTAFRMCQRER